MLYQPAHRKFVVEDPAALLTEFSHLTAAALVTHGDDGFRTTTLPLMYYPAEGEFGTLRGHWARGNPQWREVGDGVPALVIYNGPDAYVSPAWYAEKQLTGKVVPTWNYITVQAQGRLITCNDPAWLAAHVRELVQRHEDGRSDPWSIDDVPAGYIESQLPAIVGLELRIEQLEAKRKLSQNRSEADVAGAIAGLSSGTPRERAMAAEMAAEAAKTDAAAAPTGRDHR
jgi:transcriptional regulator